MDYEGCSQIYYSSVENYLQIFTLLLIRGLYTAAQEHVTQTAALEAEYTSPSKSWPCDLLWLIE